MPGVSEMGAAVGAMLKERQENIGVAESSCGGLISAALVAVPGASAFYLGSVVSYTQSSREGLMRINESQMTGLRPSTEEYAYLNARAVQQMVGATWAVGETGASGPTGNRYGDASGHACIAVVGPVEKAITVETGSTDREANMWVFAAAALTLLENCIKEAG